MTNPAPPFSQTEYDRRIAEVTKRMEAHGLDALFITDPSNMAWLTGYDGWSFYVHQGVLFQPGSPPVWWGRMQDVAGAVRTVWMPDDHVVGYAEDYVQTPEKHPMEDLARHIAGLGVQRVGLELDNYYFSAKAFLTLQAALPNATLEDATGLVNWARAVKSEEEITFMRRAARISEKVMAGVLARAEPGVSQNELVADMFRDAILGADGHWGDYAAIVPLMGSGPDASAPHLTWSDAPLRAGEATFFEIAGCYRRYHAPICRSVFFGTLPPDIAHAERALIEGLEAGVEAARPGALAGDVARALFDALRRAGIEREARCGYPIGLSYPPDWGERTISFRPSDETVLEAGMTFHFMPGLWMDDWGIEITESILIRDNGPAECLCDVPRGILVKD